MTARVDIVPSEILVCESGLVVDAHGRFWHKDFGQYKEALTLTSSHHLLEQVLRGNPVGKTRLPGLKSVPTIGPYDPREEWVTHHYWAWHSFGSQVLHIGCVELYGHQYRRFRGVLVEEFEAWPD